MENEDNKSEHLKPIDIDKVIESVSEDLPDIAFSLITEYLDPKVPSNVDFAKNPDNAQHHAPKWHQHGIITHSREFARAMKEEVPDYLTEWGVAEEVNEVLAQEIDGVPKKDLLNLASLLHDVGKFTARSLEPQDGKTSAHFRDHEEQSGDIIRTALKDRLAEQGLTEDQIEYVAACAELHFELGKLRRSVKEQRFGVGYSLRFTKTYGFEEGARRIIKKNPDFAVEIGMQFIADGLSKSEVMATGSNDKDIESQRPAIVKALADRNLNPELINQAMQMPVNLEVANLYLNLCFAEQRKQKEIQLAEEAKQAAERDRYEKYKLGHEATLAARKLLDLDDKVQINNGLKQKKDPSLKYSGYAFSKEIRESSEIAYTYDMFIDKVDFKPGHWNRGYRSPLTNPFLKVSLMTEPGETKNVDLLQFLLQGSGYDSDPEVVDQLNESAPNSLQVIGFANGMEMINPFELRDWAVKAGSNWAQKLQDALPIKIITEPKAEASKYSYIDQGILNLSDSGQPRVTVEGLDSTNSSTGRAKFFDTERAQNLQEIASQWDESGMYRVRFGDNQDYVALVLPQKDKDGATQEWVVAENYEYGNALFVIDPNTLAEGETWLDVLTGKTKGQAQAKGAVKIVHDENGRWKDEVLELITQPQS
ncbi:MAG: HD domain-containing protein [Candidatus Microsaccharimonas sp.]